MKAIINISEDAELRAAVKDLIRGQVTALVRDEIKALVNEQVSGILKGTAYSIRIEGLVRDETRAAVRSVLAFDNKDNFNKIVLDVLSEEVKKSSETILTKRGPNLESEIVSRICSRIGNDQILSAVVEKFKGK